MLQITLTTLAITTMVLAIRELKIYKKLNTERKERMKRMEAWVNKN